MLLDPEETSSETGISSTQSATIDKDCYVLELQRTIRMLRKLQAVADVEVVDEVINLFGTEIAMQREDMDLFTRPTKNLQNAALTEKPLTLLTEAHMAPTDRTISTVQHNIALKNFAKVNQLKAKGLRVIQNDAKSSLSLKQHPTE